MANLAPPVPDVLPLADALVFVHNALTGIGVRERIKIIASGKIVSGFDIFRTVALGADMFNSARGMMLALGRIQAPKFEANDLPVGIMAVVAQAER